MAASRILLVCTANQCRSPMAEGLLRALVDADVEVASSGVLPGGAPATATARAVLAARGIDIAGHVSRQLAADDVRAADLVLAMDRGHLREVVVLDPEAEERAFTLRDLAARADERRRGESLRAWAARQAAGRPRSALVGVGDDGVADPVGQPQAVYERTAAELEALLRQIAAAAFGSVEAHA